MDFWGTMKTIWGKHLLPFGVTSLALLWASLGEAQPDMGPLRICPDNPRYFANGTGKAVYLTGSHTWSNFKDMGPTDPPPAFNFEGYLAFLKAYHHNFIRLWTWELSKYSYHGKITYAEPFPWPRTGPGTALDGKPKFDLSRFNPDYFDRLRARVEAAGQHGIYVSIMLFEGHGLHDSDAPWCWEGHPFHEKNNINGINGDPNGDGRGWESQTLEIPAITALQEAYVRQVVDTVNDLDNVLYEIANESGAYSTEWQYHFIQFIHDYEKGKPKQHPVGMTFQWAAMQRGTNATLFDSPADWISPNPEGGYRDDPPAADGRKVIINDTDHLWGIGGSREWVWKSCLRGLNPIFMDPYAWQHDLSSEQSVWTDYLGGLQLDAKWDPIRRALGHTRQFADRMDLAKAIPHEELSSSRYCLANPGVEYLIYLPAGGEVDVDLSAARGSLAGEWFNPTTGETAERFAVEGGAKRTLQPPFAGDALLYLRKAAEVMENPSMISFQHRIFDAHGPENPHIKAAGDLNGDGRGEILVASSNGGPLVWYEYPSGRRHEIAPSGTWSCDAALADMDGDGDLDLVISEWYTHNRIEWYENPLPDGDPASSPWKRHFIGNPKAHDLEIGDLDGDGDWEIATRNQGVEGHQIVLWKRTAPDFWESRTLSCPAGEGLALGDLNGDGKPEPVIGGRWYEATGDILADPWTEHVFAAWPPDAVVKVADLNGDERLEVVLTRSEGPHRLSWFEAPDDPRSGLWREHVIDDDLDYAHSLVICDLNRDGQPDIVTAEMHQSARKRVMAYLNQGRSERWERQVLATTGSHNMCVANVDGHGTLVLVGANWSGAYQPVEIWEPVGDGNR